MLWSRMGRIVGVAMILVASTLTRAATVQETEIDVVIDPNGGSMVLLTRLHLTDNTEDQQFYSGLVKPTRMDYCRDANSGRDLPYQFRRMDPPEYSVSLCTINLSGLGPECTIELGYAYSGADFYGFGLNPDTLDNFSLGQITPRSVHSSHLLYYPFTDGLTGKARIAITVPQGWMGVTAGVLQTQESLGGQSRFVYEIPYASRMMPYPLAASAYIVQETVYQDRVRLGIYSSVADANYAKEKLEYITKTVLPFLEGLMGNYPLPNLRIVEIFLKEGNIGLATRGLVMLSEKTWFSGPIGDWLNVGPMLGLVDECAHQWNVYHVQFPNYLGEGISEYTDNLFYERFKDSEWMGKMMPLYREMYTTTAGLLNRLKPLKDVGKSIEETAQALGMSVEAVTPYWPYASAGEVAISDPRVFPSLYFLKGALALHALRTQLGDEQFFAGFKKVFAVGTSEPVTLDYFRQCFESVHGASLESFFQRWYNEPGLP